MLYRDQNNIELVTVLRSNLSKYITPELTLQLNALKEHLGIKSFASLAKKNMA